jgi:hypothetical protein
MNIQSTKEDEGTKPRLLFVLLPLLALGLWMTFRGAGDEGSQDQLAKDPHRSWMAEVFEGAQLKCGTEDEQQRAQVIQKTVTSIEVWVESSQVDHGRYLPSLARVEQALDCGVERSENDPEVRTLKDAQGAFKSELERLLRAQKARLRRAERQGDGPTEVAALRAMANLLQSHQGPLTQTLRQKLRQKEGDKD